MSACAQCGSVHGRAHSPWCHAERDQLRAQVADLKARLREVRSLCEGLPDTQYDDAMRVTDLRVKTWRKP